MENIVKTRLYRSPFGVLMLGSYGDRLCMCDWLGRRHDGNMRRLSENLSAGFVDGTSDVLECAGRQLDEFFASMRKEFDVPLLPVGTAFQKDVWNGLRKIPFGETVSYGELAQRAGRPSSVRAVANAVGANALSVFIPCHRVIGSDHSLTGYAGGLETKRGLLELEGASVAHFFCGPVFFKNTDWGQNVLFLQNFELNGHGK